MDRTVLTQVKEAVDIVSVIGSYIELHNAGKWYKARCPFHNEKTPSFHVSPDRGRYKCFGCGVSGDVVTFIQEIEKVTFAEAVKLLADRAGIVIEQSHDPEAKRKALMKSALRDAAELYSSELLRNQLVLAYIQKRGVIEKTISTFQIGFAPDEWNWLTGKLKAKYGEDILVESGLAIMGKRGVYDRFRSRLVFPIIDASGQVVGFTGRLLQFPGRDLKTEQPTSGKYINSPEGVLYQKSKILYGMNVAKHEASRAGRIIIVEGHFDAVLAHQAGTAEVVALSGTALTDYQIEHILKRYTDTIYLALDGDAAGIKSMDKTFHALVRRCLSVGFTVKLVSLPAGSDPADIIAKDQSEWLSLVDSATDYLERRIQLLSGSDLSFAAKEKLVKEVIFPAIKALDIHGSMRSDKVLQSVALAMGVTIESVRKDYDNTSAVIPVDTPSETKAPVDATNHELVVGVLGVARDTNQQLYQSLQDMMQEYIPAEDPVAMATRLGIDYDDALFSAQVKYTESQIELIAKSTLSMYIRNELLVIRDRLVSEMIQHPEDTELAIAYTRTLKQIDEINQRI